MAFASFHIERRDGVGLVFGMEWFPLLGEHSYRQASSLVRRRHAKHWVMAAGAAASAGVLNGRVKPQAGERLCSAAAVFAGLHPQGTVAAVIPLQDERLWLVAVHEGAVMTRTDLLHQGFANVRDILGQLQEAHPGLLVHDERLAPSDLLNRLFFAAQEYGELRRSNRLPRRLPFFAVAGVIGLIWLANSELSQRDDEAVGGHAVDPAAAWQDAIAGVAQRHTVHGVAGLQSLLESLKAMPVYLSGWALVQAECQPRATHWHCRARYRRDEAGDNQSLIDAAMPGWKLTFDPMQDAQAVWAVNMPTVPLAMVRLYGPRQNDARLVSRLQNMLSAFTEFQLKSAEPLPVPPPLDAHQRPIPRPSGVPGYQRRSMRLQAPLRSLSLLQPEALHMSWERVVLQVGAVDQPTLRASGLQVSLSGVLYEMDTPKLPHTKPGDADGTRLHKR